LTVGELLEDPGLLCSQRIITSLLGNAGVGVFSGTSDKFCLEEELGNPLELVFNHLCPQMGADFTLLQPSQLSPNQITPQEKRWFP
jgi:hypothetical protein